MEPVVQRVIHQQTQLRVFRLVFAAGALDARTVERQGRVKGKRASELQKTRSNNNA
jgi:hypothetical protein